MQKCGKELITFYESKNSCSSANISDIVLKKTWKHI